MQWYYAKGGQRLGPVEEAELVRLAQSGGLLPSDLVWHAGMGNQWQPAGSMKELFPETPLAAQVGPVAAPAIPPPPGVPTATPAEPAPTPIHTYIPVMGNTELIGHAWRVLSG
jgi:hypothetical protein